MIPLLSYPWVSLISLLVGITLSLYLVRRNPNWAWIDRFEGGLERSNSYRAIAWGLIGIWIFCGYILPQIFYFPFNAGTLGDNYLHMSAVLERRHYLKHHHLAYPLAAELWLDAYEKVGLLHSSAADYYERVFILASYPVRAMTLIGLFALTHSLKQYGFTFLQRIISFFLLSVSYAIWLWAIQPNGLGFAIGFELLTVAVVLTYFKNSNWPLLVLSSVVCAANMYVYNGSAYFTVGVFAAICAHILLMPSLGWVRKLLSIAVSVLICAWMASRFFEIQRSIYEYPLQDDALLRRLADTKYFGGFTLSLGTVLRAMAVNITTGIMNLTNYWLPETGIEKLWVITQRAVLLALGVVWVRHLIKSKPKFEANAHTSALLLFAFTSLIHFVGFALRQAGTHYYALAAVPNLGLALFLLFSPKMPRAQRIQITGLTAALAVSILGYSGLGQTRNLTQGSNVMEQPFFRENQAILKTLQPGEKAFFLRDYNGGGASYINQGLLRFYAAKFKPIRIILDPTEYSYYFAQAKPSTRFFVHRELSTWIPTKTPPKQITEDFLEVTHQ